MAAYMRLYEYPPVEGVVVSLFKYHYAIFMTYTLNSLALL
jgi:hypothetical protein